MHILSNFCLISLYFIMSGVNLFDREDILPEPYLYQFKLLSIIYKERLEYIFYYEDLWNFIES